jgi:Putative peptidoglycan binding domain
MDLDAGRSWKRGDCSFPYEGLSHLPSRSPKFPSERANEIHLKTLSNWPIFRPSDMKRRHGFGWPLVLAAVAFAVAPVAVQSGPSERNARHDRFFNRVSRFFSHFRFFRFDYPNSWYSERYDRYPDFGGNPNDYPYYFDPESGGRYPIDLAMEVQTELAQRGYYKGLIDGVIGPGCQKAIREFQAAAGLPVTGQIDDNLIEALRATEPGAPGEDFSVEPPGDSSSSVAPAPPEDSSVAPFPSPSPPAAPEPDTSPMASWVKGKEGQQVLSPFTGGVVDVSGFPPGAEVRCPYSGKIFLVPTKP